VTERPPVPEPLLRLLRDEAATGAWLKGVFSHPASAGWEKVVAEPVALARGLAVKLTLTTAGRLRTDTVNVSDWPDRLAELLGDGPAHINVLGRSNDWHARFSKSGRWLTSRGKPSLGERDASAPLPAHDRRPQHPLPVSDPAVRRLFIETGLYSLNGQLRGEAAGKYRQVQHYIELLRPLTLWDADYTRERPLRILDAGCGKAYLSLALYQYAILRGIPVRMLGIDADPGVVATVERIATRLGYEGARFQATTIAEATAVAEPVDLLVSLHACDTATDEALAAGVTLRAQAIVLAPCCHNELFAQIETNRRSGALPAAERWAATLESGLLLHRQAELLTDSLRAAALEALGYHVDVTEFVSPEDSARNVMIRAERRLAGHGNEAEAARAFAAYRALAGEWNVKPALETLLATRWPPPGV
jgi:SAM-dependent methyltransferase